MCFPHEPTKYADHGTKIKQKSRKKLSVADRSKGQSFSHVCIFKRMVLLWSDPCTVLTFSCDILQPELVLLTCGFLMIERFCSWNVHVHYLWCIGVGLFSDRALFSSMLKVYLCNTFVCFNFFNQCIGGFLVALCWCSCSPWKWFGESYVNIWTISVHRDFRAAQKMYWYENEIERYRT